MRHTSAAPLLLYAAPLCKIGRRLSYCAGVTSIPELHGRAPPRQLLCCYGGSWLWPLPLPELLPPGCSGNGVAAAFEGKFAASGICFFFGEDYLYAQGFIAGESPKTFGVTKLWKALEDCGPHLLSKPRDQLTTELQSTCHTTGHGVLSSTVM